MENENKQNTLKIQEENTVRYSFYFRCKGCNSELNHGSYNVKRGIEESPYCSKCSSAAFDTSDSLREYQHQGITDIVSYQDQSDEWDS